MAYAAGAAMGPVVGGWLTDRYGFRGCADVIAVLTLVYAGVNFCLVFLPYLYNQIKNRKVTTK